MLALGFGVFLMGTLYQVQSNILRSLGVRMDQARANVVFFDVQDNQLAGIDSIIRAAHYELIDETPIVPMRIASINGKSAKDLLADAERNRQGGGREGRGRQGTRREPAARPAAMDVAPRVSVDVPRFAHGVRASRERQVVLGEPRRLHR